jgi:hypothetical protein
VRIRLTADEKEEVARGARLAKVKIEERRAFDYSLKAYKRVYGTVSIEGESLRRLTKALVLLRDLYGGWTELAKVMRTDSRTLVAAHEGKKWAATRALAVFVAEAAGMSEEQFFERKLFDCPPSKDVSALDDRHSFEGDEATDGAVDSDEPPVDVAASELL